MPAQHIEAVSAAAKTAMIGGAATANAGGWWAFVGTYNKELGVLFAAIGATSAFGGFLYAVYRGEISRRKNASDK